MKALQLVTQIGVASCLQTVQNVHPFKKVNALSIIGNGVSLDRRRSLGINASKGKEIETKGK